MSSMLEQAIVDASALKEVALRNAETQILEKYSAQVKKTLKTILEQEEEDPLGLGADEEEGDLFGGGEEGEEPVEEPVVDKIPDAFTDAEKLCPCPDDDEEIEIDFMDLAKQLKDPEESAPEDMIDRDTEMVGAEPGEGEEEEEFAGLMEAFKEEIKRAIEEDVVFDGEPTSSGYSGVTSSEKEELEELEAVKEDEPEEDEEKVNEAEELSDKQKKLDLDDDGNIDPEDLKGLRAGKKDEDVGKEKEKNEQLRRTIKKLKESLTKTKNESSANIKRITNKNKALKERISTLDERVIKVNLANAKLLYTNKTLVAASLNGRQKIKIVEAIAKANSVEEAKNIFETLQSAVSGARIKRTPNSLSEAVVRGRTSTIFAAQRVKKKKPTEDPQLGRWQVLAGLDKKQVT
jgi:hypothetical protein